MSPKTPRRRRPFLRLLGAIAVSGFLFTAAAALGQPAPEAPPDPRVDEARQIFDAAEADFRAGRYRAAARGYERAYRLLHEVGRPTAPLVLFNVARAFDRGSDPVRAIRFYRAFLAQAEEGPSTREWMRTARQRIRALRQPPAPG